VSPDLRYLPPHNEICSCYKRNTPRHNPSVNPQFPQVPLVKYIAIVLHNELISTPNCQKCPVSICLPDYRRFLGYMPSRTITVSGFGVKFKSPSWNVHQDTVSPQVAVSQLREPVTRLSSGRWRRRVRPQVLLHMSHLCS
jgi:hypothetical protein